MVAALRKAGASAVAHDDKFAQDTRDAVWLAEAGRRGWVVLSKDRRIRTRTNELAQLLSARIAAFILTSADLTGDEMAAAFAAALPRIFKLLARRTVEENVRMSLDVVGTPRREARARVFRLLKQVGLQSRRYHHPMSLSGGEQQRLAIARALVNEPELLLADEPTGNLDENNSQIVFELLCQLKHDLGATLIIVTHNPNYASQLEHQLVLEMGQLKHFE